MEARSYKIAVVEDDKKATDVLKEHLQKYAAKHGYGFEVEAFANAVDFLSCRRAFDLVFFDIDMPMLSGMDAARKYRENDKTAMIVFVTNMPQFALQGYAVNAADYVLKPVSWPEFETLMNKAVRVLGSRALPEVLIACRDGFVKLPAADIYYIEAREHRIVYHTAAGVFEEWATLKEKLKTLPAGRFVKCNHCYVVNLAHVRSVSGGEVVVAGDTLAVSRAKRRDFINALTAYAGDGNGLV